MRIIKQGPSNCFATCVAMVCDTTIEQVEGYLGHKFAPHPQEFFEYFKEHGMIPSYLVTKVTMECLTPEDQTTRTIDFPLEITNKYAILFTEDHAVAWDGQNVFDPRGYIANLNRYKIRDYILLI